MFKRSSGFHKSLRMEEINLLKDNRPDIVVDFHFQTQWANSMGKLNGQTHLTKVESATIQQS